MTYKEELIQAMKICSEYSNAIFLGQEACYFYGTMQEIPCNKIIEMPIMEDAQMGMSIGLSLAGYLPISMYTRMDFLILTMNQLVNHLDKIEEMSHGEFKPKVIIRTVVGGGKPIRWGVQHTQDFSSLFQNCLHNVDVVVLKSASDIVPAYREALSSKRSTMLIEYKELYATS